MSDTINSSNMSLPIPVVGQDPGPQYATDVNSCLTLIDAHDHSPGYGVLITPDGININQDLPFNGFSATELETVVLEQQPSALTGTDFLSNVAGNLYFNDGSGTQIAITAAGGVAGSPGSIGSLVAPASATYVAGSKTFIWASGSSKAAAMDNGAVTIRETDVASAKGITLLSPSALAADYNLTLPTALPASNGFLVTVSTLGVMGYETPNQVGQLMSSTGADAIASAMTRATGTTVGTNGVAISTSSGNFTTTSGSYVDVTNLSVTITTSGRPIFIGMTGDSSGGTVTMIKTSDVSGLSQIKILDATNTVSVSVQNIGVVLTTPTQSLLENIVPASTISTVYAAASGTYNFKIQAACSNASSTRVANCILIAYEL